MPLGLALVGLCAAADGAGAATVRATPSIQGAGMVTAPGYSCTSADQSSSHVSTCRDQHVLTNDPSLFGVSTTLVATPSTTPAGHWTFVRWEGCESSPTATRCTVSAPALRAANWYPRAVFRDSTPPRLISGPSESYSSSQERTVSFGFAYDEAVTSQCRIDGAAFSVCSSGASHTLSEGDHVFDVRAFDASGNLSANATRPIKIVDTAITGGPAEDALLSSRSATLTFSSVAGNAFECRRDAEAFAACPGTGKTYADLDDGTHTFEVRALNGGFFDRLPATRTWRIDTTPPVVSLTANPQTPGEGVLSTATTAAFSFEANEPSAFQCALDDAALGACTSPTSHSGLIAGPHTFRVRAIDRAGNPGPLTERSWSVAVPDADGDGYNASADCDDHDAGVNPGRPEVVNNQVDENSDGAKEFDLDRDGSRADADCDDNDAARTPGKAEIPGNGVDENCDGRDAIATMTISLAASWKVAKAYTVLKSFALNGAPRGSKAVITCTGRKCPRHKLTLTTTNLRQPLHAFAGRKLTAGTVIAAAVSRPGFVTAVKSIAIRAGKAPAVSAQTCLPPDASKPTHC